MIRSQSETLSVACSVGHTLRSVVTLRLHPCTMHSRSGGSFESMRLNNPRVSGPASRKRDPKS